MPASTIRWLVIAALAALPRAAAAQPDHLTCPDRITTKTGYLSERSPRFVNYDGLIRAQCYGGALTFVWVTPAYSASVPTHEAGYLGCDASPATVDANGILNIVSRTRRAYVWIQVRWLEGTSFESAARRVAEQILHEQVEPLAAVCSRLPAPLRCPAQVDDLVLDPVFRAAGLGFGSDTILVRSGGYREFECRYYRPAADNVTVTAFVDVFWYTQVPVNLGQLCSGLPSAYADQPTHYGGRVTSGKAVAWSNYQYSIGVRDRAWDRTRKPFRDLAARLLAEAEPLAAPCKNRPPVVDAASARMVPSNPTIDDTLQIQVNVSDPDGDPLHVTFLVRGVLMDESIPAGPGTSTAGVRLINPEPGEYTILAGVSDDHGNDNLAVEILRFMVEDRVAVLLLSNRRVAVQRRDDLARLPKTTGTNLYRDDRVILCADERGGGENLAYIVWPDNGTAGMVRFNARSSSVLCSDVLIAPTRQESGWPDWAYRDTAQAVLTNRAQDKIEMVLRRQAGRMAQSTLWEMATKLAARAIVATSGFIMDIDNAAGQAGSTGLTRITLRSEVLLRIEPEGGLSVHTFEGAPLVRSTAGPGTDSLVAGDVVYFPRNGPSRRERFDPRTVSRWWDSLPTPDPLASREGGGVNPPPPPPLPPVVPPASVDLTVRELPSGPLPQGSGWRRQEANGYVVQSSAGLSTWTALSREPVSALRVRARLQSEQSEQGTTLRTAGILLTSQDRAGPWGELDVYLGLSPDGRSITLSQFQQGVWRVIGGVAVAGGAPDRLELLRDANGYTAWVNAQELGRLAAAGERKDWAVFVLGEGARATLFDWQVERVGPESKAP